MTDSLVGCLCAGYVTYVLVESTLLDSVRPKLSRVPLAGRIIGCYNCCAFWAGLFTLLLWVGGTYTWWFAWVCAAATGVQFLTLLRWKMESMR